MNRGTRLKISASRDAGNRGEHHACSGNGPYFEPERTDRGPRPANPADWDDWGLPMIRLLMERGADLSMRAKIPGHYERPQEVVECAPLGYALRFEDEPSRADKHATEAFLRGLRAPE